MAPVTSTTFSIKLEDAVEEAVALKNSPYKEKTWRLKFTTNPRNSAASPGVELSERVPCAAAERRWYRSWPRVR